MTARSLLIAAGVSLAAGGVAGAGKPRRKIDLAQVESMDRCDALVREYPRALDAYRCYWALAMRKGKMRDAARRLEAVLARDPANHRARLYLGSLETVEGGARAVSLLLTAVEGLRREREYRGEVYGRTNLAYLFGERGLHEKARNQLDQAARAAQASGDPALTAMVLVWRGQLAVEVHDLGKAASWYRRAEAMLFPGGPRWLQQRLLRGLGDVLLIVGDHRKAFQIKSREVALLRQMGNRYVEAWARFGLAYLAGSLVQAGEMSEREENRLIREALRHAIAVGNRSAEADTRVWLLGGRLGNAGAAVKHLERAAAFIQGTRDYYDKASALRMLAKALWHADPSRSARSFHLLEEAISWARSRGRRWLLANALLDRAYLRWRVGPRTQAVRESLAALALVDRLRGLQPRRRVRARVGSTWAYAYYLVSGHLLTDPTGSVSRADQDLAFGVMERLRARTVLESFASASPGRGGDTGSRLRRRRLRTLARISSLQKRLLSPTLSGPARTQVLARLRRRESEEESVRDQIARTHSARARVLAAGVPSLAAVRRALDADTALLVFQTPPAVLEQRVLDGVGSWVFAISREEVRVHALPGGELLRKTVAMLQAAVVRRDGSERAGAARLHRDLVGAALGWLPPLIRRLVIVPDGALHRLPFGVLRSTPAAAPLAEGFEITQAPSVATWLYWKRKPGTVPPAVLAIADPKLPTGKRGSRPGNAAPWIEGLRLGQLPHGREEARLAVQVMGGASRLLSGSAATERFLKTADLRRFGIVHFAAHAIVDDVHPDRSAVVLAAGAPGEDGLLQFREVPDLDVRDRIIVLSACQSSAGTLLPGEGVLSLARGFFQAGARTVLGSLWPLRDDEARLLLSAFYRSLGRGRSLGGALAAARRERLRAGAPSAAWAGLILLGDRSLVPIPAGRSGTWWRWPTGAAAALLLLGVAIIAVRRRRAASSMPEPPPA